MNQRSREEEGAEGENNQGQINAEVIHCVETGSKSASTSASVMLFDTSVSMTDTFEQRTSFEVRQISCESLERWDGGQRQEGLAVAVVGQKTEMIFWEAP